ncbi:SDR family NAD(P)-dependent oxidoreductase [Paenibacillus sacheonensis]|uniref:SDR family NAD(P)-dependent oxidoreductase n=1 Tax=Paenibacillus sacheonensis TaxID=742054 RepID=A0A7X4YWB7_9BACL|nr:SDR family oxidoreductase [Paenibacillus sacheonensis]MBM7569061.1 3-oxoacyl-[acyl-carrier protein] reductase [Paenibacillus sacheonensis]NBC72759.1 SDR family NAD(P)-dependent oxidoreductase [Paenibacillus sacheonensis]
MVTMDLRGKNALVTGSSRGLGKQYAIDLARAGANVIIHDINEEAAARFDEAASGSAVAAEIAAQYGVKSRFLAADMSDPEQVKALIDQSIETLGSLDILINNAGGDIGLNTPRPDPNDALDISVDDIRSVVERNLLSTMYACKFAGLHMRERRSGKIVNVGSVAGHVPVREGIIYAAAKMGISQYTRSLAEQLRPFDVNVNCISPTATYTARFLATRTVSGQENLSRLQQIAQPEEMSDIILFLCGPQSDALSGETIVCWR